MQGKGKLVRIWQGAAKVFNLLHHGIKSKNRGSLFLGITLPPNCVALPF